MNVNDFFFTYWQNLPEEKLGLIMYIRFISLPIIIVVSLALLSSQPIVNLAVAIGAVTLVMFFFTSKSTSLLKEHKIFNRKLEYLFLNILEETSRISKIQMEKQIAAYETKDIQIQRQIRDFCFELNISGTADFSFPYVDIESIQLHLPEFITNTTESFAELNAFLALSVIVLPTITVMLFLLVGIPLFIFQTSIILACGVALVQIWFNNSLRELTE